jgi:ABC-type phosphate/phosphonate transport system substrate-binding protein
MQKPIVIGAVIYQPKVAVAWDFMKEFFHAHDCPIDYIFFSNYERQVTALLDGYIDIAWNSALAWIDVQRCTRGRCRAIAMRDVDRERVSHIVVARGSGLTRLDDLRGKVIATGARDSPAATLIPLQILRRAGLSTPRDFKVRRFDVFVGTHGDHDGGEREALDCLARREADAACVLDLNWKRWTKDGTIDAAHYAILTTTPKFDGGNFTVLQRFPIGSVGQWTDVLLRMDYGDSDSRKGMDLVGTKGWLLGRATGYRLLAEATRDQKFFEGAA